MNIRDVKANINRNAFSLTKISEYIADAALNIVIVR